MLDVPGWKRYPCYCEKMTLFFTLWCLFFHSSHQYTYLLFWWFCCGSSGVWKPRAQVRSKLSKTVCGKDRSLWRTTEHEWEKLVRLRSHSDSLGLGIHQNMNYCEDSNVLIHFLIPSFCHHIFAFAALMTDAEFVFILCYLCGCVFIVITNTILPVALLLD